MKLLIVKTSSMGDVVHALPVVADLHAARPGVEVHWLVEAPFAPIVRLHPGVARVHTLAWRQWRKRLGQRDTWQAMASLRRDLRAERFDLVIDLQGLVKSALWARQAGAPVGGFDRASVREPLATLAYRHTAAVPQRERSVARYRALAAALVGHPVPDGPPRFGLRAPAPVAPSTRPYAVLMPASSRPQALWPMEGWIAVARWLSSQGVQPWVFWDNEAERTTAERLVAVCDGLLPPLRPLDQVAATLAGARLVVSLDTGLAHLAAALGRPTVGIYGDQHVWKNGLVGEGPTVSLGGKGQPPTVDAVMAAVQDLWRRGDDASGGVEPGAAEVVDRLP
jgi:heptosyltransferase-1